MVDAYDNFHMVLNNQKFPEQKYNTYQQPAAKVVDEKTDN